MKTRDAIALCTGLKTLIENKERVFPGKIGYAINRNFRKLAPIVEDYDRARMALVIERGEPVEDQPGTYNIKSLEDQKYINEQIDALLEVENDDIKLSMIQYTDIADLQFSPAEIDILYPMIKEDEEG